MNTNTLITTLVVIAIIIYAIFRQLGERRVKKITFFIIPLIAAYKAYTSLPIPTIPVSQILECIIMIVLGLLAGAIQASFTKVYYKGDQLYMRGGKETLMAWFGLLICRIAIKVLFQMKVPAASFQDTQWIIFAGIAATFGFRSLLLTMKHPEIGEFFSRKSVSQS